MATMVSVADAYATVMARAQALPAERLPLLMTLGRTLAGPVAASVALPPFDNAAMDGYAVRAADLASVPARLRVAAEARAGMVAPPLRPGKACRVMTGAPLPAGADAVVKQEDVLVERGYVTFHQHVAAGEHVRRAGEDVAAGQVVLAPGHVIDAGAIALLAGLGRAQVSVHALPRVAVLTSGDELAEPGRRLAPGMIYNSNAYALMALVMEAGGAPTRLPVARDDRTKTRRALREALDYDVVITTGGVSVGRYDFVGEAIAAAAEVHFAAVAQQPGKPFMFATAGTTAIFGLPGNPGAAMLCAELYVRPYLRALLGRPERLRPRVAAVACGSFTKKPGREAFVRAVVTRCGDRYEACLADGSGPGALRPLALANALLVVPAASTGFAAGEAVEAMLLDPPVLCRMACGSSADAFSLPRLAGAR